MENHGKYGEFIYTHNGDTDLYVNLFIPSRLSWKENSVTITQETSFPYEEHTRLTVESSKKKAFTMHVRCPEWVDNGFSIKVNGKEYAAGAQKQSYVSISRKWKNGDVVEISLPMRTELVELDNETEYLSVKRGPIVLAAKTSQDHLDGLVADDGRWGHIANGELVPIDETPIMIGNEAQIRKKLEAMKPVPGKPFHYTVAGLFNDRKYDSLELEPFYGIHDSRYAIYFLSLTEEGYGEMLAKIRAEQEAMLVLDRRTVDKVTPGEQQPEADHKMQSENSMGGNQDNKPYRSIRRAGSFSFEMDTDSLDALTLSVGYWGAETAFGSRALKITVDGEELLTETSFPNTGEAKIVRKEYSIPKSMLEGKQTVRIGFSTVDGSSPARVFDVRLLK